MDPNSQPGPQPAGGQQQVPNSQTPQTQAPAVPQPSQPIADGISSTAAQSQVAKQMQAEPPAMATPTSGAVPGQAAGAVPPAKGNPNSTQNTLEIAEIRDGVAIMNDGSFRAVVMARSINFDLMSAQEREAVELGYQNFLNSLYFDIQIVIRSRKVDMKPYLERLTKIRNEQDNMLLGMLMEDYIYYIGELVEQTNIMSKQFYITIPYYPTVNTKQVLGETKTLFGGLLGKKKQQLLIDEATLNKAKTELQNRVQNVMSGLLQLGVQSAPLDTKELIELYYDAYNPDTATRQPLTSFENLAGVVITKGQGDAAQPQLDKGM